MPDRRDGLTHVVIFVGLVALGIAGRVLPHPPNFTPVAASALFAGALFRRRSLALLVPAVVMVASDLLWLGSYEWRMMLTVYAALALPAFLGRLTTGKWAALRVGACSLAASIGFYLTTNFAVWAFGSFYEPTLDGLWQCYAAGAPFFKYTVAGDLTWSAGLFGALALATRAGTVLKPGQHRRRGEWLPAVPNNV